MDAQTNDSFWKPVSTAGLAALIVGVALLMLVIVNDDDGFIQILDGTNLAAHEFGHPFFGILGDSPEVWGGTLMQLLVPLVIAIAFIRERAALSFALAGVWFFENFLNIARYMADARAQELPLVGGGEHDWANILSRHGLLDQDTAIAHVVRTIGWIGMVACVLFAVAVWMSQRAASESVAEARPVV